MNGVQAHDSALQDRLGTGQPGFCDKFCYELCLLCRIDHLTC